MNGTMICKYLQKLADARKAIHMVSWAVRCWGHASGNTSRTKREQGRYTSAFEIPVQVKVILCDPAVRAENPHLKMKMLKFQ